MRFLFKSTHAVVGTIGLSLSFAACGPLPLGNGGEPRPGFAKFALGNADAVRWAGTERCTSFDIRTGKDGPDRLTKVEGRATDACNGDARQFEFVYRKHSNEPLGDWTTAWRPLNAAAASRLLENCTWETRPEPSSLVGHWWRANNTYAENTVLEFIAPSVLGSSLVPFDDDGHERLGEETVEGVETVVFENDRAKVWMIAGSANRPLRVVHSDGAVDVHFTEWDVPFAAAIPDPLRDLSEVCVVDG